MAKRKPSKAEQASTVDAFFSADAPPLDVVDRSTLENVAACPAMSRFIETGAVLNSSFEMESGNAVHDALSAATVAYVSSRNAMSPSDVAEEAWAAVLRSRPDVQPDAIRGLKPSLYAWSHYLGSIHFENILAFDGGEGQQSGQLAHDFPDLRLRITSEIDLLHAGPSPELLHEIDYKSGNKLHTARSVAESFQFMMHAVLVFENFPDCQGLELRVWNTRSNRVTYGVEFRRDKLAEYLHRVRRSAEIYRETRDLLPAMAPTWPTVEKCGLCPAAHVCPVVGDTVENVDDLTAKFVDDTIALEAKLDARLKLLAGLAKRTGREIEGTGGNRFGRDKPKKEYGPKLALYQIKQDAGEEESEAAE